VNILVLNPSTSSTKNVVRDVLYGCWCSGKRIGGGTVPPFALLQVAAVLKEDGNDVGFLDAQAEQTAVEDIRSRIENTNMVIISTSTMTFEEDANTLQSFKDVNPDILTVVFGSHPTFLPEATLSRSGVDVAVRYEPEYVIRDIAKFIKQGRCWKEVQGIAFKVDNHVCKNPQYPFIKDLDELPFLDLSMLPKDIDYFNPIVRRMPYITTSTSRGCPGRCSFCTAPAFDGDHIRYKTAEYVIKEIEYFMNNGFKEVYFRDDTFFVNRKRDRKICKEIVENRFDISWIANARIGMIDKETMEYAKEAGCHTIKFGVESGVQSILNRSRKGYQIRQAHDTFKWANEVGMATHAHCMLGMPGDNETTIKETIKFVKELNTTTATFGICTPYPGAPLYDDVLKIFPEIGDGSSSDLSKLHTDGTFNEVYTDIKKEDLERYVKKAYRSFYMRPKVFLDFIKQIRSIEDIKRITLAGARVLDFALFGN
jgi:anaerobic magnesium-protoporphyrin IX monomethyl ester cyclase